MKAMSRVSDKYKIRLENIKVLCSIYLEDLHEMWEPNLRKNKEIPKEIKDECEIDDLEG